MVDNAVPIAVRRIYFDFSSFIQHPIFRSIGDVCVSPSPKENNGTHTYGFKDAEQVYALTSDYDLNTTSSDNGEKESKETYNQENSWFQLYTSPELYDIQLADLDLCHIIEWLENKETPPH